MLLMQEQQANWSVMCIKYVSRYSQPQLHELFFKCIVTNYYKYAYLLNAYNFIKDTKPIM